MILFAIIGCELKYGFPRSEFILYKNLQDFYKLEFSGSVYFNFEESIYNLQERGLINIIDFDNYPVSIINEDDQLRNYFFLIPIKPSFMPFSNKKFQLTSDCLNKFLLIWIIKNQ